MPPIHELLTDPQREFVPMDDTSKEKDALIPHPTLIEKINKKIEEKEPFFSLEFFPPKTPNGAVNLIAKIDRLNRGNPLFCDITWHPAGDPAGDKETSSSTIASVTANYCGVETMLHMTCANTTRENVLKNLRKAKNLGLRNILALRGGICESSLVLKRFMNGRGMSRFMDHTSVSRQIHVGHLSST